MGQVTRLQEVGVTSIAPYRRLLPSVMQGLLKPLNTPFSVSHIDRPDTCSIGLHASGRRGSKTPYCLTVFTTDKGVSWDSIQAVPAVHSDATQHPCTGPALRDMLAACLTTALPH